MRVSVYKVHMSTARVSKKKGVSTAQLPVVLTATKKKGGKLATKKKSGKTTTKVETTTSTKSDNTATSTSTATTERTVYTGYFREDQPMSQHMHTMFTGRVALLEAQLRLDHKGEEDSWTRQRIRDVARETAIGEFFEISRAPFGRKRGIAFQVDFNKNRIEYAASVWTAQFPGDSIRAADLMAQAQARFNVGKRRIRFDANLKGLSLPDIQRLVVSTMYERGATTRSDAYRRFVRKENGERFKNAGGGAEAEAKKKKKKSGAKNKKNNKKK